MGRLDPNEKLLEELGQLMKLEGNRTCADCGARAPRWTSTNLGVFLCIQCAGIHRSLGTHISKVKSATLDKWTPALVEHMRRIGNDNARLIYEGRLPPSFRRPRQGESPVLMEAWIRKKYEEKAFFDEAAYHKIMNQSQASQPTPTKVTITPKPTISEPTPPKDPFAIDLIDMSTPTPSKEEDFFSTPTTNPSTDMDFFSTPTNNPPAKRPIDTLDILSLYGNTPSQPTLQGNTMGGGYQQQQSPMMGGGYPQQQHQPPMMGGGYPPQHQPPMMGGGYPMQQTMNRMGGYTPQQPVMGGGYTQQQPMMGGYPPQRKSYQ